jgi:hypothetical protein
MPADPDLETIDCFVGRADPFDHKLCPVVGDSRCREQLQVAHWRHPCVYSHGRKALQRVIVDRVFKPR